MCLRGVIEQSRPFYANARRCIGGSDGGVTGKKCLCLCWPLRGASPLPQEQYKPQSLRSTRCPRNSTNPKACAVPAAPGTSQTPKLAQYLWERACPAKRPELTLKSSDVTLLDLAPRQPATVALLGQARGPGRLDAEPATASRLLNGLGRLGSRHAYDLGRRLGRDRGHCRCCHGCRCCCRLGGLAQFGQRRGLAFRGGGRLRFDQRTLARLAGYVRGHGSADKGLTAAPTGGIEAIGGKVSNQNRTSPKRCH